MAAADATTAPGSSGAYDARPPGARPGHPGASGYRRADNSRAGIDETAVDRLLAEREGYRRQRDYANGDRVKLQITAMGVRVDDKEKTWTACSGIGGGFGGGFGGFGGGAPGHGLMRDPVDHAPIDVRRRTRVCTYMCSCMRMLMHAFGTALVFVL